MRLTLTALLSLTALPVFADEVPVTSQVTAAELYPQSAKITRLVPFELSAGSHELQIQDLPLSVPLDQMRISAEGVTLGAVTFRQTAVPPTGSAEPEAITAAKAEITRIEDAIRALEDQRTAVLARAKAAEQKIALMTALGASDATRSPSEIVALLDTVGEQTEAALKAAQSARIEARQFDAPADELAKELQQAEQALAALVEQSKERAFVSVAVTAEDEISGQLELTYIAQEAGWRPSYDLFLEREADTIELIRGAVIHQETGENWQDVALTLSTRQPSGQTAPNALWPWLIRIEDEPQLMARGAVLKESAAVGYAMEADTDMAPPVVETQVTQGIAARFSYSKPLSLASGADGVQITLGTDNLPAEFYVVARPQQDDVAFAMATLENSSETPILSVSDARYYMDGQFITRASLPGLASKDKIDLPFGPILGIQLNTMVNARNEGDRGFVRKSTETTEESLLEITNLTQLSWPLRVQAVMPYSEQEELEISWQFDPAPQTERLDGQRGMIEWRFDLAPEEKREVTVGYRMRWPEGKVLQ